MIIKNEHYCAKNKTKLNETNIEHNFKQYLHNITCIFSMYFDDI